MATEADWKLGPQTREAARARIDRTIKAAIDRAVAEERQPTNPALRAYNDALRIERQLEWADGFDDAGKPELAESWRQVLARNDAAIARTLETRRAYWERRNRVVRQAAGAR